MSEDLKLRHKVPVGFPWDSDEGNRLFWEFNWACLRNQVNFHLRVYIHKGITKADTGHVAGISRGKMENRRNALHEEAESMLSKTNIHGSSEYR
jgi:hypothetical protein